MTTWSQRLLVANVVVFLAVMLGGPVLDRFFNALVLVPVLIPQRPWSVLTYAFLHADLMHLLFNMIGLYFFGPRLEMELGSRHFLGLYFTSAIVAALASFFTPYAAIVGASGAVFGVLFGFARYWPTARIYFWGVIPIQARWFIVLMAAYSIWAGLAGGGRVAHFAHLGGLVGGWLYLKVMEQRSRANQFRKRAAPKQPRVGQADIDRWRELARSERLHPVNREELERILRKVDQQGAGSLDRGERDFLERLGGSG